MSPRTSWQSVVLPAPEGADTTIRVPRRLISSIDRSFDVLRLLAELLERRLGRDHGLGDLEVVRLGSDGVHLPVHLLDQEVERAADGAALGEEPRDLLQMRAESGQLLADVDPLRPDRHLR